MAKEVAKTHPDHYILAGAYSGYREPPLKIAKLEPNVIVTITNGRPIAGLVDETFEEAVDLRKQWLKLSANPLHHTLNYPWMSRGAYQPMYFPHTIARGIRDMKGQVSRETAWLPETRTGLDRPGMNHLNGYVMASFWWNADQDVDALLDEYYHQFYSPAAEQMKAFIEYSEANYTSLTKDKDVVSRVLELFDQAKAAVAPDSVYGQRIALVDDYLKRMRDRSTQMGKGRDEEKIRKFGALIDLGNNKWQKARKTLVMDGKLDEPFWVNYLHGASLVDVGTAAKPKDATVFYARWWNNNLYLGIRCAFDPAEPPVFSATKDGDRAIFADDHLEILLETGDHSYYQILVNPAGAVLSLDRGAPKNRWYGWSSAAEAASHIGKDFWSVEIRIPVSPGSGDPLHTVIGNKPITAMPWYFNIFRESASRHGEVGKRTISAFSPSANPHDVMQFGKLWDQRK